MTFDDSSNIIYRQYPNFQQYIGENIYRTRLHDFLSATLKFWDKFQEMYFRTNSRAIYLGIIVNSKTRILFLPLEKVKKIKSQCLQMKKIPEITLLEFYKIVRNISFHHSSNPLSTSSIPISATATNFNIEKEFILHD